MAQQPQNTRLRNAGFLTFFFSGICAISSGVVVSLLQEKYGFAYGMTGTLLSLMSIGNLLAGFLTGVLPGVLGFKPSVLLLTTGYALGYGMMGLSGAELLLSVSFFLVGIAKGSVVQSKNFGKDFMAGMKTLVGGEIESYTQMLTEARQIATKRMVDDAEAMGADAVIGIRYTSASVMQGAAEITAYGTAVRIAGEA